MAFLLDMKNISASILTEYDFSKSEPEPASEKLNCEGGEY